MFTKNNNTYLFPSSPLHHHNHHPDIFSGHHYNIPALADLHRHHSPAAAFLNNQDEVTGGAAMEKKQTAVKKDRHSKIFTSQGPRDRRVRLSIGIARKFFDLQEMLGFDKPSKTLDWLLTKSKAAIKDLVQAKEKHGDDNDNDSSSPVPSDEYELGDQCGADSKGKSGNKNKGVAAAPSSSSLTKAEARAKARARARERTREKMCIKEKLKNGGEMNNSADHQLISPFNYNPNPVGVFQQQELGQESVLTRRKTKSPNPSFFGLHQNVFVSGSGYGSGFGNGGSHENWDVCSFTSILDQHRFMNRSSDM